MADQTPAEPNHPKNQPADLQELGAGLRRASGEPDPETPGPGRVNSREMNGFWTSGLGQHRGS